MSDPFDDNLPIEDQRRLYEARTRIDERSDCVAAVGPLKQDIPPPVETEPCATPVTPPDPDLAFQAPNTPPSLARPAQALPAPLVVRNLAKSRNCTQQGKVPINGSTQPSLVTAGVLEEAVYIDTLDTVSRDEIFRLTSHIDVMQEYVDLTFSGVLPGDFSSFDAGLAELVRTSIPVAVAIRELLVLAQGRVDTAAENMGDSALECGYLSARFWVVCADNEQGYTTLNTEPDPGDYPEVLESPLGAYESSISQLDADTTAAKLAALSLACLKTNATTQTATCSDIPGLEGYEAQQIAWPVSWIFPDLATEENPKPISTLESQSPAGWDFSVMETDTALVPLSALNGQEFMLLGQVGTGQRRTLRTISIIPAGDPRTAAKTVDEANAIAMNIALQELDCFVPNSGNLVTCGYDALGNPDVAARMTALTLNAALLADCESMHGEMLGGLNLYPDEGPSYPLLNSGVESFDEAGERLNQTPAFAVFVWPGMFFADTPQEAEEVADAYGAGLLRCEWISPHHESRCDMDDEDPSNTDDVELRDAGLLSVKFSWALVRSNVAKLNVERSIPKPPGSPHPLNVLPRGFLTSETYPRADSDPELDDAIDPNRWDSLPEIAQAGLSCLYESCQVAYCEPKPDDRPKKVNGERNWATWGDAWYQEPASRNDHQAFLTEWNAQLTSALGAEFAGPPCPTWTGQDYDKCATNWPDQEDPVDPCKESPASQFSPCFDGNDIVHRGPDEKVGEYGAPARFKYGGILRWGFKWGDPASIPEGGYEDPLLPEDPNAGPGGPTLLTIGTVKACSQPDYVDVPADPGADPPVVEDDQPRFQAGNIWGFYSGAEGYSEGYSPVGLGDQAVAAAQAAMDCTHISWPRSLFSCPQPYQRPFGKTHYLSLLTEGSSTREANEALESLILQSMQCQDAHNGLVVIDKNKWRILSPAVAYVGDGGGGGGGVGVAEEVAAVAEVVCR